MNDKTQSIGRIMLTSVRLSFPGLFEATAFKPGDEPKYKATLLIPKGSAQAKAVEAKILAVLKEKYPAKAVNILATIRSNANKCCWQDGEGADGTPKYDGYEGMMCLAAHRPAKVKGRDQVPPLVLDNNKAPLTSDTGRVYAGCFVNAKVSIYVQSGENPGVRASFSAVQFWRDGDAFSANTPSDAGFESAAAGIDADDFS